MNEKLRDMWLMLTADKKKAGVLGVSLAVLTGWALCSHILDQLEIDAELVVAKGEIRYRAPITGDIECHCGATEAERDAFVLGVEDRGKGTLALEIQVGSRPAAVLQAVYCAIAR